MFLNFKRGGMMSLTDDGPYPDNDETQADRELAQLSTLANAIADLEKLKSLPDDKLMSALTNLAKKAPAAVKQRLTGFQTKDVKHIRLGLSGLISSLSREGADEVRRAAAARIMDKLCRKAIPAWMPFLPNC